MPRNTTTMAEYVKQWRHDHPEANERHRLTYAARLLTKHGFVVIPPTEGEVEVKGR